MGTEGLLTTPEVAERLGITIPRVHQLIKDGRLPSKQFGRTHLIREEDLALVADRKPGRPKKSNENETTEKVSGVPKEYPLEAAEQMRDARPKKATKSNGAASTKTAKKRATKKAK
jgi:excisionase family DNA binding protein